MIKVFTTNKNGKIELTKDELKKLLDEAYWEGYKNNCTIYTYQTPNWSPYQWTTDTTSGVSAFSDATTANATTNNVTLQSSDS